MRDSVYGRKCHLCVHLVGPAHHAEPVWPVTDDECPLSPRTLRMTVDQVLWECFRHFYSMDEANAAFHTAPVRYSPITFRLAEHLAPLLATDYLAQPSHRMLRDVVGALGAYEEDKGR